MLLKNNLYKFATFFVIFEVSVYLANDMIMPGMVNVIKEFNAPISYAATSLSCFILGGCSLPLILNRIIDKVSSKKVLLFGNGLFLVATILIACTDNIHEFLIARLIQGMGLGFIFIGYSTVHKLFDDVSAIKLIALLGNVSIMAPLAGPLIGGIITNTFNWRFVFIVVGILGSIAFYGLSKYMPEDNIQLTKHTYPPTKTLTLYINILKNKMFLMGAFIYALNNLVTITWIGISPVILFDTYKLPFKVYATYQILVFSGTAISSLLVQYITGQFKAFKLIKFGSTLALIGLIICFIFNDYIKTLSVFGICIFNLGTGLYIGIVSRLVIAEIKYKVSAITALNSLIASLTSCIGLELSNYICSKLSFTILTLSLFNLAVGVTGFLIVHRFMKLVKNYQWN